MEHVNVQLTIDHDVTAQLLRSDIIDWVTFQEVMYTKPLNEVIALVRAEYEPIYIEMIPELANFLDLLYATKEEVDYMIGNVYSSIRIKAVFDKIVVVSVTYNKYRKIKEKK